MPPRRMQRLEDDEHPASKAMQQQQSKKKPQTQQKKPAQKAQPKAATSTPSVPTEPEPAPEPVPILPKENVSIAPSRKSKRQQREEEELAELVAVQREHDEDDDSEPEHDEPAPAAATSVFASLQLEDVDTGDDDGDAGPKKPSRKKKKKKATAAIPESEQQKAPAADGVDDADGEGHPLVAKRKPRPPPAAPPAEEAKQMTQPSHPNASSSASRERQQFQSTPSKASKKKAKKAKVDEFEEALAELVARSHPAGSGKRRTAPVQGPAEGSSAAKLYDLLSVSLKDLDAATELKRFFGSRVIAAAQASSSPTPAHDGRPGTRRTRPVKGVLVQPQAGWPKAARAGIFCDTSAIEDQNLMEEDALWWSHETRGAKNEFAQGERIWAFNYDESYVADTYRFVEAVRTMDPQNLINLLHRAPWHADALLQVSEYYRHRDEHQPASDLVERAIYAFERPLAPGPARFAIGRDRLEFRFAENRALFLALSRHVVNLIRRGVTRTAFETAKFLLALDPWADPQAMMLHLDFLAPKSGQTQWLLEIWDVWPVGIRRWPGMWYSRVLCLKGEEKRRLALQEAIQMFPEALPLIADKADIVLPGEVLGKPQFKIHLSSTSDATQSLVHLLAHVYADRTADLWKDPDNSALLSSVGATAHALTQSEDRKNLRYDERTRESVFRHVVQFEAKRAWQAFVPATIRGLVGFAWDPLPPTQPGSTSYDQRFFESVRPEMLANEAPVQGVVMQQIRLLYQQFPLLADMFPDPDVFVRLLHNDPGQAMQILEQARNGGGGAPVDAPAPLPAEQEHDVVPNPGRFDVQFIPADQQEAVGDDDEESDEESEEDDEEEQENRPFALRVVQGLFGRWGAPRRAGEPEAEPLQPAEGDAHGRDSDID